MGLIEEKLKYPPGKDFFHLSFVVPPDEDLKAYYQVLIKGEQSLSDSLIKEVKDKNVNVNGLFRRMEKQGSFDLATVIAAIETTYIEHEYPQVLTQAPQFPHLYRFLRSVELFAHVSRGGNTLMVGSGITIPEFLAQYIKPPEPRNLERFASSYQPGKLNEKLEERLRKAKSGDFYDKPANLLPGKAIAIEPDSKQLQVIDEVNNFFGVPPEKVEIYSFTIAEAIIAGMLPANSDTVLWHRADPLAAATLGTSKFNENYLEQLLKTLNQSLARGGRMIISAGDGNNVDSTDEREERKRILPRIGITLLSKLPDFFEDETYSSIFGNRAAGMIGCLVAKKN